MKEQNYFKKCLITGNEDLLPLKGYEKDYLVKSKSSGFVFSSRIPTEKEIIDIYANYPVGYNTDSIINNTRVTELLIHFERFRRTNRILDVGCGPGLFLIEAKKRGWEVFGTEFTDEQIKYLNDKGIQTFQGKLASDSFEKESFDIIISSEVIEHINNPLEEMSLFNSFLRRGGVAYITTPNFNAIERFLLKGKYNIIHYPEHLCYYTPKTINLLLEKCGFEKMTTTTTGLSITRVKNSLKNKEQVHADNLNNDSALRASLEEGYKRHFKTLANFLLNYFKVGNSLKAWYVKQ